MKKEKTTEKQIPKWETISTLNCSVKANQEKLENLFCKVVKKYFPDVDAAELICDYDRLLKLVNKSFYKKFGCYMSYVFFSRGNIDGMTASLIDTNDNKHDHICSVYARTIQELFMKSAVCFYFYYKAKYKEGE